MLSQPARDELILTHMYLVSPLVTEVTARVPTHVRRADLVSAGNLGLVLAGRSFDDTRGAPFARWAALKIRGAVQDELRSMDWAPRSLRARARAVESCRGELAATLGRTATAPEIAKALGTTLSALRAVEDGVHRARVLSLDGFNPDTVADLLSDTAADPAQLMIDREKRASDRAHVNALTAAIGELPDPRLRYVMQAVYLGGQTLRPIAAELHLTESMVSRLHREAIRQLRDGMNLAA